ncbi:MAG: DUF1552 domain-containing protein [Planctomycetota bacterium]
MKLARRQLLKSATAALALPTLEALLPRGTNAPTRAVWLYFPNGVATGSWAAADVGPGGALRRLAGPMAPLERHRENLVLLNGVHTPHGNGHGAGTATWLTGGWWNHRELDAHGPSVDQVAARAFTDDCVVPALSISARGEGFFAADVPRNTLSWSGPRRPVFRETDPRAIFGRLFGSGAQADRSLLDDLKEQLAAVKRDVSSADRERLDAYLDAIRGIERRIAFVSSDATARRLAEAREHGLPFDATSPPAAVPEEHDAYLDLLLDLVALALWSDASRVASVMLDHGQSNRYCTFVPGVKGTWHALSHWKDASGRTEDDDGVTSWDDVGSKRAMYDAVVTWHHERVAKFLDRLRSLPEPRGTLLDETMVVYGSSIADGHEHGERDLPTLIAGGGGGTVRGGRVVGSGRALDLSRVHLATLRALGVPAERFASADAPFEFA